MELSKGGGLELARHVNSFIQQILLKLALCGRHQRHSSEQKKQMTTAR